MKSQKDDESWARVVDPDLSQPQQRLLSGASKAALGRAPGGPAAGGIGPVELQLSAAAAGLGVLFCGADAVLAFWKSLMHAQPRMPEVKWYILLLGVGVALLVLCISALIGARERRTARLQFERIRSLSDRIVLPEGDLTPEVQPLLQRAQDAAQIVLSSRTHEEHLMKEHCNEDVLRAVWEVADELRSYSSSPEDEPGALKSIESRVAALERYAQQTRQADRLYAEWEKFGESSTLAAFKEALTSVWDAAEAVTTTSPELARRRSADGSA